MKKLILSFSFLFVLRLAAYAGEGMWIPLLLSLLNEKEMQSMGMKMTAEDIYSVNKGSLKDAIVHFGGGCTGEIISSKGLLLTNHHCGYGQIQRHSSLEHNYLEEGFWAKSMEEELPNEGLTATFISRIEDVTAAALQGVTDDMDKRARQSAIDKNLEEIKKSAKKESWEEVMIRPFFYGNQYFMFITVTYRDVRLVGAPPSSIGKFGADTDNWIWPRHTGDFSLFRVYADKANRPADYSPDNRPLRPKHFLPISLDGVVDGDFTLVFGFPGRTSEYLPSFAVQQIADVLDPAKIAVRDKTLAIWDAAMRSDAQIKIQYASKQAGVANAWKKWQGEVLGLRSTGAVEKKQAFERDFMKAATLNPKFNKYAGLLGEFERLYRSIEPYSVTKDYYDEITRNIEALFFASQINRLPDYLENQGEEGFASFNDRLQNFLEDRYKNYSPEIDRKVCAALLKMLVDKVDRRFLPNYLFTKLDGTSGSYEALAGQLFDDSWVVNGERSLAVLGMNSTDVISAIQGDPLCRLSQALTESYNQEVISKYNEYNERLNELQTTYMKALMEVFPNKTFYPDANSTLRCSYGRVQGYKPRDGVQYFSKTYLDGVMEKYVPGDYEFDVPGKLRELYLAKDYGPYAEGGRMPVCFIGSNHTTGGNSGSPAIDAYGNLVGLNFDRVWEGTMSDYNYDLSLCRNIMVDIRYVLFIVDKYAGADHLIKEMKLVHPKMPAKKEKSNGLKLEKAIPKEIKE